VQRSDFSYDLPEELIAQHPAEQRDQSRLLVLYRSTGQVIHKSFTDFPCFAEPGDLLILNNSKVIPARLRGIKPDTGGNAELLLLEEVTHNQWWCMLKPGKRLRVGSRVRLLDREGRETPIIGELTGKNSEGHGNVRFSGTDNLLQELPRLGETPLPPYIARPESPSAQDDERYQTVYASPPGSVAAPTAGLHFTDEILERLRSQGVQTAFVTLHVGLGTFAPVKADNIAEHQMHYERYLLPARTARLINRTRAAGRRIIAVGTTSVRVLESLAAQVGPQLPERDHHGRTNIFIYPPYEFQLVDRLLTNFHLPESTLLMLVAAFAGENGREKILAAYRQAVEQRYRFFSYGDAMLML